jgi:hypothetical protein
VLGVFWGSIEVDTNPDFDSREVDYDGIKSMPFLLMEYLTTIADAVGNLKSAESFG